MNDDLKALALPFDKSVEATMVKGGTRLTYVPVSEVIHRLNEVLAYNWSYTVQSCQRDPLDLDYVVAHVTVKVYRGTEEPVIRDGFGGVKIKRTRDGSIVDLGDEYKGAVSDALKKAAQAFGVGLYLARHEEKETQSTDRAVINPSPNPYKGENIKALFPEAREINGELTVKGDQYGELPAWLYPLAAEKGVNLVWDNRKTATLANRQPWFKCVDTKQGIWPPKTVKTDPVFIAPIVEWETEEEPF